MMKRWWWLSQGSCLEYPWILVTAPLICWHHRQLTIYDVFGQSSVRHSYNLSSPVQLGNKTMVETAGIPAWERTLVLGTSSHQVIFIREHTWCCCSWSFWHKCLWYGHHTLHLYSRADMTTVLYTLHLVAILNVLWLDTIFQLTKGKAGFSGSWLNLWIQRCQWWQSAHQVAELSDWIDMSGIHKDSWFYIAWARSCLV